MEDIKSWIYLFCAKNVKVKLKSDRRYVKSNSYVSCAQWLKKTRRKALFASLEKIKEG